MACKETPTSSAPGAIVSTEAHTGPLDFSSFALDPACRVFLDRLGPRPDPSTLSIGARRLGLQQLLTSHSGTGPRVLKVEDIDAHGVPIRVYRCSLETDASAPCLVYCHGGGWNAGSVSDFDVAMRALAVASNVVVISVEYRLAPESPAPAAVEDALAVLDWLHTVGGRGLGVDCTRIGLGGDSAGGSITASVTHVLSKQRAACADRSNAGWLAPPLALQLLIYPSVDLTCSSGPSYAQCARGFMLEAPGIAYCAQMYAGGLPLADPSVSPLLASEAIFSPGSLPRALIYSAGFDPLRR